MPPRRGPAPRPRTTGRRSRRRACSETCCARCPPGCGAARRESGQASSPASSGRGSGSTRIDVPDSRPTSVTHSTVDSARAPPTGRPAPPPRSGPGRRCRWRRRSDDDHEVQAGGDQREDDRGGVHEASPAPTKIEANAEARPRMVAYTTTTIEQGGKDLRHEGRSSGVGCACQRRPLGPRRAWIVRSGPTRDGQAAALARQADAAREHLIAGAAAGPAAASGDDRVVDQHAARGHDAVDLELVARGDDQQVPGHDVVAVDQPGASVADDGGADARGVTDGRCVARRATPAACAATARPPKSRIPSGIAPIHSPTNSTRIEAESHEVQVEHREDALRGGPGAGCAAA